MKILGVILIILGILIFVLSKWVLAPKVCKTIPEGQYKAFIGVLIYSIIIFFIDIGVALPLFLYGISLIIVEW